MPEKGTNNETISQLNIINLIYNWYRHFYFTGFNFESVAILI